MRDILVSSAILLSGNNFDKIHRLATFARMNFMSKSTFQQQQANYIIPAIESHWERVRNETCQGEERLSSTQGTRWC